MIRKRNEPENFHAPLYLACGKGEYRESPKLHYIYFIDGYAHATNAHVLIKQSLDYCGVIDKKKLNGKCIHRDDYKSILKYNRVVATDNNIVCYEKDGSRKMFKYGEETPLEFEKVYEQWSNTSEISELCVDMKLVEIATKCLYNYSNYLKFSLVVAENCKGLKIECKDSDYANQFALVLGMYY